MDLCRFVGLLSTCLLNLEGARERTYNMDMYGDKETFWIGFTAVQVGYTWNPVTPGAAGRMTKAGICSIQLLHIFEGAPMWINGGLFRNKNVDDYRIVEMVEWGIVGEWEFGSGHMACLRGQKEVGTIFSLVERGVIERSSKLFGELAERSAPVPVKLSEWSYETQRCGVSTYLYADPVFTKANEEKWRAIDDYKAQKFSKSLHTYISNLEESESVGEDGIVYFVEKNEVLDMMVGISMIKLTGCVLKIEVW